jgi:hypothetical protein
MVLWLKDLLEESAAWPAPAGGPSSVGAADDDSAERQLEALRRALLAEQAHTADLQVQVLSAAWL